MAAPILTEEQKLRRRDVCKKYRENNQASIKASKKKHYEKNKEAILKTASEYKATIKEKISYASKVRRESNKELYLERERISRERNRESILLSKKKYYESHKEEIAEKAKIYAAANSEATKARNLAWVRNNPEKVRAIFHRRRARLLSAEGSHTASDIENLIQLQNAKCAVCRCDVRKSYHVDHIMPLALGGSNYPDNLQILCPSCNLTKAAKHPVDFMQQKGFLL